jgi:hypothetical protein
MAGITLAQAESKLAAYMAAEDAVLTGQEYSIGARRLTRADLSEIRKGIAAWEQRVIRLTAQGGIRVRGAVPL